MNTPTKIETSTVKMIPWKQILVPGNANIRQSMPEVKRLAASLADKGQLAPIIVTNGGTKDQPYTVVAGFRRMAAYVLNGWQDKDIMANVLANVANDPVARMAINWTENMQREDVSPLDQAEALNQLVTGTYPMRAGEKAAPVDKKTICEKFDMSSNHLGALVRVHSLINHDVKLHARKVRAPLRLLIAMARIKAKNAEALADAQHVMLQEWIDEQEALESEGRKRKERSDKGKGRGEEKDKSGNDNGTFSGLIKPTRKIDERGTAQQYLTVLNAKVAHPETTKEEKLRVAGMIELMRYLTGDLKRFPLLTKEDFIVLEEEEEEEEAEVTEAPKTKA